MILAPNSKFHALIAGLIKKVITGNQGEQKG